METTDAQLISLYASNRDAEAFAELVARRRDMVYGACYRVLRNAADAEDAAQDCFVELARRARSIRSSVPGWLHRVAARTSMSTARRDRSRKTREREAAAMAGTGQQESAATRQQIQREVDRAIDALPDNLREPLVRHFLEGTPQTVLARELGISQPAVSQTIKRGIEGVRRHLGRAGLVVSAAALMDALTADAAAAPATLVAALGKLALAGVQPAAATAPLSISAAPLAKAAFAGWQAKLACTAVIAVVGGVAVREAVRPAPNNKPPPTRSRPMVNAPATRPRKVALLAAATMAAQLAAAQPAEPKPARRDWKAMSREARRLYVAREYEQALPLYWELVRVDVNNHAWVLNCLIRLERTKELIDYCIDYMPSIVQAPAATNLALYQLRKLVDAPGLEAEAPRILTGIDSAVELLKTADPAAAAEFLHAKGMMFRKRRDPAAAVEEFGKALAALENAPDAQAKIFNSLRCPGAAARLAAAECYLELGDPTAAYEMVEAALNSRTLGRAHYFPRQYRSLLNRVRSAAEPRDYQAALRRGVATNAAYPWITETIHACLVEALLEEGQLDEALTEARTLFWVYTPLEQHAADVVGKVLSAHDKTRARAPAFPDFALHYTLGPDGVAGTDDDLADPWAGVATAEDSPHAKAIVHALSQVEDDWPWREHLYRGCLMRLANRPRAGLAEITLSFAKARAGDLRYIGVLDSLASAMRQVGGDPRLDAKIDALLGETVPPTAAGTAERTGGGADATEAPWQEYHGRGTAALQAEEPELAIRELVVALALIRHDHPQMPGVAQALSKAMDGYARGQDSLGGKLREFRRAATPQAPK